MRTERPAVIKNASMPARRSPFLPFSGPTGEQLWLRGLGQTNQTWLQRNYCSSVIFTTCSTAFRAGRSTFASTLRFYSKLFDIFLFELSLSRISNWDSVGGHAWVRHARWLSKLGHAHEYFSCICLESSHLHLFPQYHWGYSLRMVVGDPVQYVMFSLDLFRVLLIKGICIDIVCALRIQWKNEVNDVQIPLQNKQAMGVSGPWERLTLLIPPKACGICTLATIQEI